MRNPKEGGGMLDLSYFNLGFRSDSISNTLGEDRTKEGSEL